MLKLKYNITDSCIRKAALQDNSKPVLKKTQCFETSDLLPGYIVDIINAAPISDIVHVSKDYNNIEIDLVVHPSNMYEEWQKFALNFKLDYVVDSVESLNNALRQFRSDFSEYVEKQWVELKEFESDFEEIKNKIQVVSDSKYGHDVDIVIPEIPNLKKYISCEYTTLSSDVGHLRVRCYQYKTISRVSEKNENFVVELNKKSVEIGKERIRKYDERIREERKRVEEEKTRREKEMIVWIEKYGSKSLKIAHQKGYEIRKNYEEERCELLFPDFQVMTKYDYEDRANPSETGLETLIELEKKHPGEEFKLVWITDCNYNGKAFGEAIIVKPEWSRYYLYIIIQS